ncbi:hypothetical protein ACMAZD_26290 (plasmid) [Vibrio sp. nBUS_14]
MHTISEIDRFFPSSKRCNGCGFVYESMPLNISDWTCPRLQDVPRPRY